MLKLKNNEAATEELASMFLSLLMALAFTSLTRPDLAVYITALQRVAQKPQVLHIRRLNSIVRWAQGNPKKLEYFGMVCKNCLECHSDAGFRREVTDDGDEGREVEGGEFRGGMSEPLWTSGVRIRYDPLCPDGNSRVQCDASDASTFCLRSRSPRT